MEHNKFPNLLLAEADPIRTAMSLLNKNSREVVLVCDETLRMAGLITDGDIRRGLLAGETLDSPVATVMRRNFYSVTPEVDRAAVLDLMKARMFQHVPVLDPERRLVGIHFLRDLIGGTPKPNIAVIMAGGKGTRLRPITETIPKPMVEIAGRPMLERIVLHLIGHGIHDIHLAVKYKAEMIEDHFGDGSRFGCRISYLREEEPRGTGGALSLIKDRPAHPILVLNGDQVMRADITAMLDHHRQLGAVATLGIGPYQIQVPFGTVTADDGYLLSLHEKPSINLLVNRGIYVVDPSALELVPDSGEFPITDLFESLLKAKKRVGVFYFNDYWLDVGQPSDLRSAHGNF